MGSSRASAAITLALLLGAGAVHARTAGRPGGSHIALPGGLVVVGQSGAATTVAWTHRGRTRQGRMPPDASTIISAGTFETADLVGTVGRDVVVLTTTYASQTGVGGPDMQCAAGQEIVLRVVVLTPRPHQTFATMLESCWTGVYRMPVSWDAATTSFRFGDGAGSPDDPDLPPVVVGADGRVRQPVPAP